MNKRAIFSSIIVLIFLIIGISAFALFARSRLPQNPNEDNIETTTNQQEEFNMSRYQNSLITYFSVTGNTAIIANYIQDITGGELAEIIPAEAYTSEDLDYNVANSRANQEQNSAAARPAIKNAIDISSYDTIFVGYPIWWNNAPKIIYTFLDSQDFSGKTVIPFCTSGGSGISGSLNSLKSAYPDIEWGEGDCFTASTPKSTVMEWLGV